MQKRKLKLANIVGIMVFTFALVLNIQTSLDGGITIFKSGVAQSMDGTDSGGDGSGGDGSGGDGSGSLGWDEEKTSSVCTVTRTRTYWICGGVVYYSYQSGRAEETETTTFTGVMTYCNDGTDWSCSERCVGK